MSTLLTKVENSILTITINRPEKLNALNLSVINDLHATLKDASSDKSIRAIIITGSGEKAFVAGADISEFANFNASQGEEMSRNGHKILFDYIENYNKPVIAAVNGFALGGGLELAMSCHVRVASANAKMGLPELGLGIIPGYGGTQRLAQLVGKGKAMEMTLTSDMVTAEEAYRLGLVNHAVATAEELMTKCVEIATKTLAKSPMAINAAIASINAGFASNTNGYEIEISEFGKCFETADFKEGVTAFLEKRKPAFVGA